MATMQSFIDADQARKGAARNQTNGCFLPEKAFAAYSDLDGTAARAFFESHGYEVIANGDVATNGIAITKCGWTLSTNGHLSWEPNYAERMRKALGVAA